MGAFFTNLHVRNATTQQICAALPSFDKGRAYVSPEKNGWVTVYCESTEDQSARLPQIASGLSKALGTEVITFLVHDSDIAMYWLFRNGNQQDEFNSAPDYFKSVNQKTLDRVRGNADALLPLCIAGTQRTQVDEILHPADERPAFAEEIVTELAKVLGIDEIRASLGFAYFDEEAEDDLPDAGEFEPVGKGTERKNSGEDEFEARIAYPHAVLSMIVDYWSARQAEASLNKRFGNQFDDRLKQIVSQFAQSRRELLEKSSLPNRPSFEELEKARNEGLEALAELIAKRTPDQLAVIGVSAIVSCSNLRPEARSHTLEWLEPFFAALLKRGLDPTAVTPVAMNPEGLTALQAAEKLGKDSQIYLMAKAAAERKF